MVKLDDSDNQAVLLEDVVAVDVTEEDYMRTYAEQHMEWVSGTVIKLSPSTAKHNQLVQYFVLVLKIYMDLNPIGKLFTETFVMRLEQQKSRREPDVLVVLNSSSSEIKDTHLEGPADICIEVVSPESGIRDRGEKFTEYQNGGVTEYWIVDPEHEDALFYRLNEEGKYRRFELDMGDNYSTSLLPGLLLHVPTLWQEELPGPGAVFASVQKMLREE